MLTVFTPSYNRKELLKRVYESLLRQTDRDFVWLIVDDGSADGTGREVQKWIGEKKISIRYIYQENGGKMRAHNTGVKNCSTELFVCLDSDDYFTETAVETIKNAWTLRGGGSYAGIIAHKGESSEKVLYGQSFPMVEESTLRGLYRQGFSGETTLAFRTSVLKEFLFPEIKGEKYVPEDYIYDKIDERYTMLVVPKILTVCEIVDQGYTDQAARLRRENPAGWYLYYEQRACLEKMSLLKIKYISHFICFSRKLNKSIWSSGLPAGLVVLGIPGALLLLAAGKM